MRDASGNVQAKGAAATGTVAGDFDRPAVGVCLESFRDEGRGVIAWMIVQKGTLKVGDDVLCGTSYGRIRAIGKTRRAFLLLSK